MHCRIDLLDFYPNSHLTLPILRQEFYFCWQNYTTMKEKVTIKKMNAIKEAVKKNSLDNEQLIAELQELRELVKDQDPDPLVVKSLRLTYEYLEMNGKFNIQFLDEEDDLGMSDFEYLLELIGNAENESNREELREYVTAIKPLLA